MKDKSCPQCSQVLTVLQSSGQEVCRSCGWVSKSTQLDSEKRSTNVAQESSIAAPSEESSHQPEKIRTTQFNRCPSCEKSLPSQQLEPGHQVCTSCGWTNQGIYSLNDLKPRFTVPTRKNLSEGEKADQNLGAGCSGSIFFIVIGCVLLLIPIIGWIIGGIMILMGLMSPFIGGAAALGIGDSLVNDYELIGDCPYCTNSVTVRMKVNTDKNIMAKCETCQERILVKEDTFYTIVKRYSA
jgi:DNA-directed RNA polymerase subunit M/transcription elongation factor TFIIS